MSRDELFTHDLWEIQGLNDVVAIAVVPFDPHAKLLFHHRRQRRAEEEKE